MQNFIQTLKLIGSVTKDIDEMNKFLSKNISAAIMDCAKSGNVDSMEELYKAVPDWHHSKETVADMIREMRDDKAEKITSKQAQEASYSESKLKAGLQSLVVDIMALEAKAGMPSAMDEEFVQTLVYSLPKERYLEFIYEMTTRFTKRISPSKKGVPASVRSDIITRIRELIKAAEALS